MALAAAMPVMLTRRSKMCWSCSSTAMMSRLSMKCAVLEHGMDGVQELAHDGTDGLELLEAAVLDEVLV